MEKRFFTMMWVVCSAVILVATNANALNDTMCRTPPMGFNTWNYFHCNNDYGHGQISEATMKSIADGFITSGMKDAGYRYVNIDDCWGDGSRDSRGGVLANKANFPSGMKALADYVHGKGLKLGIYTDVADLTCSKRMPGMLNHENQDADTFVAWGIDYAKVDYCSATKGQSIPNYVKIRNAFRSAVPRMKPTVPTAHPILFSVCNWGYDNPWEWGDTVGHLWRTTADLYENWTLMSNALDGNAPHYASAGPTKGWNDPDMIIVGVTSSTWTLEESRSHFAAWCIMAAPLILSADPRNMNAQVKSIVLDKDAIAVDQDSLGKQGIRLRGANASEVWVKQMKDSSCAVLLFNRTTSAGVNITINWSDLGWPATDKVTIFDIWSKTKQTGKTGSYTATGLAKHASAFLRMTNESQQVRNDELARKQSIVKMPGVTITQTIDNVHFSLPASLVGSTLSFTDLLGKRYDMGIVKAGEYTIAKKQFSSGILVVMLSRGNTVYSKQVLCIR